VVAADTGLMSGEGVSPAMIGGSTTQRPEEDAMECYWRRQARSHDIETNNQDAKSDAVGKLFLLFEENEMEA